MAARTDSHGVAEITALAPADVESAVTVLARGMRDNPLHVAAFGDDPERRRRSLERMFRAFFTVMTEQTPLAAWRGSELVGVAGIARPGTCQPGPLQTARLLPGFLAIGPGAALRVGRWASAWAGRDLDEPHSHLGPLAVDAHLQGQGIGSRLLAEYCARLDSSGQLGYLETDKPENVRLYERFGFEVIAERTVIGVDNWFMRRGV